MRIQMTHGIHSLFLVTIFVVGGLFSGAAHSDKYAGFPEPKKNFDQHIDDVAAYLLATQMQQRDAADVQYNLPFEIKAEPSVSYKGAFFLVHGLNDSPYIFSDLATALSGRGYDVRAILLPGHGNSPEAQLNMKYERWLDAARAQLAVYKESVDGEIFLGGFSMGGVIATILALENEDTGGLFLFSPAFKSSRNNLLRWASIYSKFEPWVFGGMIIEDNPTKYNSIPINGVAQYYKLIKKLNAIWRKRLLEMPVLVVASTDDSVVDIDYVGTRFKDRFTSTRKKLILYSNDTAIEQDGIEYRSSTHLEDRILNQSHQSVLVSEDNPLFGKEGRILVCNGNDWPTFSACLYYKGQHWFGAQNTPSPDDKPVARVTYNPDFAGVLQAFDQIFDAEE